MAIPHIIFKKMSLEDNIEIVKWCFYSQDNTLDIHKYTISLFKELSTLDPKGNKDKIDSQIERVVTKIYLSQEKELESEIKRYNEIWSKYNDDYFIELSKYLNISYPEDMSIITSMIGIIPIFPRYLDTYSFSLTMNLISSKLVNIVAHESLHFLWFKKWLTLYPKTKREELDTPYPVWIYSEMVTDPILNSLNISSLASFQEKAYDTFYNLKDNNSLVMDKLKAIYQENITIEEKIKKGYIYVSKFIKELSGD